MDTADTGQRNSLMTDLKNVKNGSGYKEFSAGYFKNVPEMTGYLYRFRYAEGPKIYLILQTSEDGYDKSHVTNKGFHFVIFKVPSKDYFVENFPLYMNRLLTMLSSITKDYGKNEGKKKDGLPHGYKEDANGKVVMDLKEVALVKRIFQSYLGGMAMGDIAKELNTNFSYVRNTLMDSRYLNIQPPIVDKRSLMKVKERARAKQRNKTL